MKYTEFKKSLESGESFSIYVVEGEDAFFRERAVDALRDKFVTEPSLNCATFDGGLDLNELLSSLFAYPLMSEKRMTVVRDYYPKAEFLKGRFKEFLDDSLETSLLVFVNEKPSDTLKKIKTSCLVDCSKADVEVIVKWIKARCNKSGVAVENSAAVAIAEYCQSEMTRIEKETEKLIAFVGQNGNITQKDVDENVNKSVEYKIYELTDFVGRKQFNRALSVIKDMMGKGETPQRILTSLYNYFRRLLHVAISDLKNAELGEMLGIKEFAVKKAKEQSALFKKRALKGAVDMLADADYKIKTGKMNADEQMWIAVFKIMTENT